MQTQELDEALSETQAEQEHSRGSRIITILFITAVMLMLALPAVLTNRIPVDWSPLDNRFLKARPIFSEEIFNDLTDYVADRVGLRAGFIEAYQVTTDRCFHELNHPLFEYGKDDWIMTINTDIVQTWHLEPDLNYAQTMGDFIAEARDIAEAEGAGLLFWLLPNKESIYPEYLPDEYNINTAVKKTKTETILEALDERDVEYVFPRELFLQLKQLHPETLLYNKKYDPLHWNQNGAFAAYSQLYQAIRKRFPAVTMLAREEFEITDVIEHYQCISCFPINEPVPRYSLKTSRARIYESSNLYWDTVDRLNRNSFFMRSVNDDPALADTPKLLIFHDSYLMPYLGGTDFLSEHFREVTLIHNLNLSELRFFIQLYRPDLVILESVEREMNPYADYYCYELAWNGFRE